MSVENMHVIVIPNIFSISLITLHTLRFSTFDDIIYDFVITATSKSFQNSIITENEINMSLYLMIYNQRRQALSVTEYWF